MKIAYSTLACPDWSWREVIENGKRFGYDGVEIRQIGGETDLLSLPEFQSGQLPIRRRELDDLGFEICGLSSSVRFDHLQASEREKDVASGISYLRLARELGAGFVRVFGDRLPESGDEDARTQAGAAIAEGLQRLGESAEQMGVNVVLETHGDFSNSINVRDVFQLVRSPAVGVLWDTHHPWRFDGEALADTHSRLQPWIRHTHWKDSVSRSSQRQDASAQHAAAAEAHALMSGHRHADYVLFGGGEFPAETCMSLLHQSGYEGWYCYEWEKLWHPEIEDPEIALPLFPAKIRRLADRCREESAPSAG